MAAIKVNEQQERQCYFLPEECCTRKCIHFSTCIRNPHRNEKKGERHDERKCDDSLQLTK